MFVTPWIRSNYLVMISHNMGAKDGRETAATEQTTLVFS